MAPADKEGVVRKSRFSEEKMVSILREADREPVGQVAERHGISEQAIYNWQRHFGSMDSADVKKLRELEQENARLKNWYGWQGAGQSASGQGHARDAHAEDVPLLPCPQSRGLFGLGRNPRIF